MQPPQRLGKLLRGAHAAHVQHNGGALKRQFAVPGKLQQAHQQIGRNIVDAIIADVLQRVHGQRLSRTGKPCYDQQFSHTVFIQPFQRTTRISLSRVYPVCSFTIFATVSVRQMTSAQVAPPLFTTKPQCSH